MLADLPSEIIYHIASYLPTASSLTRLAQTCRRLHQIITTDGRVFRAFVQNHFFPSIEEIPPFWKDATQALTSRSRALDKFALIARFMAPAQGIKVVGVGQPTRHDRPTIGYRPSLDSYEVWTGGRWEDREEVLAWGAAEKIYLRIRSTGNSADEKWLRFNDLEDVSSHDDIRGVHLLRPNHPAKVAGKEHIIYGRARGDVTHVAIDPDEGAYTLQQTFITNMSEVHSLDLSPGAEPILAVHNSNDSISLYRTTTAASEVSPFAAVKGETEEGTPRHYTKFLSPTRLAVGYGRTADTILISDITGDHISTCREFNFVDPFERMLWPGRKARVGAIAPLGVDMNGGNAYGEVFLAGWGNSRVRLHDLRSPRMYEREYIDVMDSNPVYCIQPFNNRFLVGAGAEAIINIFDLRMQNAYNYLYANSPALAQAQRRDGEGRGEFSCFLSHYPPGAKKTYHSLYRGPIYTMSSPSPISSTVYTGVVGGVMRLNFGCTDDLFGSSSSWYQNYLDLSIDDLTQKSSRADPFADDKVLELSGYERPGPEVKSTSAKLRSQVPFWELRESDKITGDRGAEWDRRWRKLDENQSWRSRGRDR